MYTTQPLPGGRTLGANAPGPNTDYVQGLPPETLAGYQGLNPNQITPEFAQSVQNEQARRSAQTGPSGGQAAPTAGYLQSLLAGGLDPQAAIQRFNQETGRTTGNEAVYYGPEVHGTATIGLPDAYLSLQQNGWQVTPRSPERGGGPGGGGMPNFAQIAGGQFSQGVVPQFAQMPQLQQAPSFADIVTTPRPGYVPFMPYQMGRRM